MARSEHRDRTLRFRHPMAAAVLGIAIAFLGGAIAHAQENAPPPSKQATFAPDEGASIRVWNRQLFTLHAPFGKLSAPERAAAAQQRIDAALDSMQPEDLTSTWVHTGDADGVLIRSGALILFGILPADVDGDREAAERAGDKVVADLKVILKERAAARRWHLLLRDLAVAVLAIVAFAAIVHGLARARHRVHARIDHASTRHAERRRAGGLDLRPIIWGALRTLVDIARLAATLALAYLTLSLVLRQFPYTRPWGEALGGYVVDAATRLGSAFVDSIPQLMMLLVIWLITRGLARVVSAWFHAIEHGTIESDWLDAQAAGATRRLATIGIWLFAITIAYPYIPGSGTESFKGVSVFVGLMLSLGSAGVLNQVVSGFVVLYSRAIRVGDFVRVGEKEGTVRDLGLLSLKLVTRLNEEITVPNAVLAGTLVENYTRQSRESGLLIATSVTIGYDSPWRQVHALLELAASRTPQLLQTPKPFVLQSALSDFYTQYQLNAAIARPQDRPFALSRLHAEIQDAFNEFGVQIMSPNFEAQPEGKVFVPREQWHAAPADKADAPS